MKKEDVKTGAREKGYHPQIDTLERGEVDLSISKLKDTADALGIDPACLVVAAHIPEKRLLFLNDFIRYLSGKAEPKHFKEIKKLVDDTLMSRSKQLN